MKDGRPFAFAGLSERWLGADGEVVDSCTIVTTAANALLRPLQERMPVIVAPGDYARWLDTAGDPPLDLVAPFPAEAMTFAPVSTRVNAVRNDDASLIEPVDAPVEAEGDLVSLSGAPAPAQASQEDLF
jgi:putative SOS response-associated peptidase YedK